MKNTRETGKILENLINELLGISNFMTNSEIEEIREFLDIHEFGMVLMTYRGICIEENKPPLSSDVRNLLFKILDLLGGRYDRSYLNKLSFE